jgi:hypothetical protein
MVQMKLSEAESEELRNLREDLVCCRRAGKMYEIQKWTHYRIEDSDRLTFMLMSSQDP